MPPIFRTTRQLGAELRRHRKRLGLSQTALGLRINKRQATISTLESEGNATIETLFAVLSALDMELAIQPRTKGGSAKLGDIF
jgi:HTH-type transcriptional regulator / antitoxin HipB